ncbi:MAG TPA: DUF72 domain-containing protein, partial [bacterium]|nr:DUF72 domain-containing protein [bacterium]
NDVATFLSGLDIGWCAVDEPRLPELMPPVAAVTGAVSYLRFHGRNAACWWEHEEAWERHDYLYSVGELSEWIPKLERMVQQSQVTAVVFNNTCWGQGIENAQMLLDLLPSHLKAHAVAVDRPPKRIETRESRPLAIARHRAKRAAAAAKQQPPHE